MIVLNYGLGTNSTALIVEAVRRGIRLDVIVAADTGDERRYSYAYAKDVMDQYLATHGQPSITWVRWERQDGTFVSISQMCLKRGDLPSKAYGLSGCTSKWKQQPIDKYLRGHPGVRAKIARGGLVERWIGYDYDEPGRAERMLEKNPQPHRTVKGKSVPTPHWKWMCPLVDWKMGRAECVAAILGAGLPLPGKSSCVMCPSMTKKEILAMRETDPDGLALALRIEDGARASGELRTVKGLGRRFSWREFLEGSPEAAEAREVVEPDCGCFDGDE